MKTVYTLLKYVVLLLALSSLTGCIQYGGGYNTGFGGLMSGLATIGSRGVIFTNNDLSLSRNDSYIRVGDGMIETGNDGFIGYNSTKVRVNNGAGGSITIPGIGTMDGTGVHLNNGDFNLSF
jgi:hypothetical protein